jgi:hypothetical protein
MKAYVLPVLCILAFQVVSGDAIAGQMPRSNSEKSSSTGIQATRPNHPTLSKSRETVSAHWSHSPIGPPVENQKTAPSRTTMPSLKSSDKVPTSYRSHNQSAIGSSTRSQKMPPSNTTEPRSSKQVPTGRPTIPRASPKTSVGPTVSKSTEKVSTGYRSPSAIGSPTRSQKTAASHTTAPSLKSSDKVPASYTSHNQTAIGSPTTSQKMPPSNTTVPRSSKQVPTSRPTIPRASPKTSVSPTITTTSDQKAKSSLSRGPFPTSTKTPKSSPVEPPPASATTTAKPTTTHNSTRTSTLVSATKTLTVSNGQTVSARVGGESSALVSADLLLSRVMLFLLQEAR